MAGYCGWSMSNNAVAAYERGEKPLSKWTKQDILWAIEKEINAGYLVLNCSFEKLKKTPAKVLREMCLHNSSWHHTGKYFRRTDFYSLDTGYLSRLTDEIIDAEIAASKNKADVEPEPEPEPEPELEPAETWVCKFLIWRGPRNRRRATERTEKGVVRGDWFYSDSGIKKSIHGTGFEFIRRIS